MESVPLLIQHRLNPLHVYCRLIERGVERRLSLRLCRCYEIFVHRWLIPLAIASLTVYRLMTKAGHEE